MAKKPEELRAILRGIKGGDGASLFILIDWLKENQIEQDVVEQWEHMLHNLRWYEQRPRRRLGVSENARRWIRWYMRILRRRFKPGWRILDPQDDAHYALADALWRHVRETKPISPAPMNEERP